MRSKKQIFLSSLFLMAILLLTACDESTDMKIVTDTSNEEVKEQVNEETKENKDTITYKDTLEIGKEFYSRYSRDFIYSGIVDNSVLITVIKHGSDYNTTEFPIYIPIARDKKLDLPGVNASIEIDGVDRINGTIDMILVEQKY